MPMRLSLLITALVIQILATDVRSQTADDDPPEIALTFLGIVERSGQRLRYRVEVTNRGTDSMAAKKITVQAYQSADAVLDASDPPAGGSRLTGTRELRPHETHRAVFVATISPDAGEYLIVKVASEPSQVRSGHPDNWKAVAFDSPLVPGDPKPEITLDHSLPWWAWLGIILFGIAFLRFMGWAVTALRRPEKAGALMAEGAGIVVRMTCGVFVLAGLCWMLFGVVPTFWNGSQSHRWPTVEGVIEESSVTEGFVTTEEPRTRMPEHTTTYYPHVRYRYEVADREYHSGRWRLGESRISTNRQDAEVLVQANYVGKPVTVHYDPDDPSLAVLEPGVSEGAYIQLAISSVWIVLGLIVSWAFGVLPFVPPPRRATAKENQED